MGFCRVILSGSLETFSNQDLQVLTYSIPEELKEELAIGSLVLVPFRNRKENALVIDIYDLLSEQEQKFSIRDIEDLLTSDLYSKELVDLIDFVAKYYCCSYSEVLNAILPSQIIPKATKLIKLNKLDEESNNSPLHAILLKSRKKEMTWTRLRSLSGLDLQSFKAEISKLKQKKIIDLIYQSKAAREKKSANHLEQFGINQSQSPTLTEEQAKAVNFIESKLNSFNQVLIHGVTGSGKTEIYLNIIAKQLANNKSSILLVPEISLAPQLVERIAERFGSEDVLIWHSALSDSEKEFTYRKLLEESPKIVVGARSAIFSPVKNLGLIIIDEEHENSYKQETPAPRYNAKEVAVKRAELNDCLVIFGSATPSLDLYYKAVSDKFPNFHLLSLSKRVFDNPMPKVTVIDMREEFNNANKSVFSRFLKSKIEEALARKEQIILFLNKRGSASHVFCRNCGFVYKCKSCDSKIVFHADKKLLLCHHCGYSEGHPQECPECTSTAIKFFGLGTQKLEDETKRYFPEARIARLDSDVAKLKNSYFSVWQDFKNNQIDILIGTQMIAKGLDFPNLTLVGVVFADTNFSQIDYSADERSFQLLTQVAGRAGRADKPGLVVFQTYQPEKNVIVDARDHNYGDFYSKEIALREELHYPPFGKLIKILFSSENELEVIDKANNFHEAVYDYCEKNEIALLGPCPALIAKIKNKFRYHLILKMPMSSEIEVQSEFLKKQFLEFRAKNKSSSLNILIDVDNVSLY